MRISPVAAVVLALIFVGPGEVNAQTADVQRTADAKLAIARLKCGIRIASSIRVLAEAALAEPIRHFQQTGTFLLRQFDRLITRPAGSRRREETLRRRGELPSQVHRQGGHAIDGSPSFSAVPA
jgi:hypothetical protein